jgi:regulator of protease activity HflC (stomatin/prohibitin superfamily)
MECARMSNQLQPSHKSLETPRGGISGVVAAVILVALLAATGAGFAAELIPVGVLLLIVTFLWGVGFYTLQPNMAVVLTIFGRYAGTDRTQGLRWVPFWILRKKVSLRARNVTSEKLKVNDNRGNPIEIAANVVWHVADTAQATFDVENYLDFVNIQIETGLRAIASSFAYDHGEESEPTLRASGEHVAEVLRTELQVRVGVAGISIDDARISHLAYAPEIAGAMLRRQQARAIIEARKLIVEGAVGMVEHALAQLGERRVVELDEERKATMVSNLLVVLCSDHDAQPVLNTGTLYG